MPYIAEENAHVNFVVTIWGQLYVKVLGFSILPGKGFRVGKTINQDSGRPDRKYFMYTPDPFLGFDLCVILAGARTTYTWKLLGKNSRGTTWLREDNSQADAIHTKWIEFKFWKEGPVFTARSLGASVLRDGADWRAYRVKRAEARVDPGLHQFLFRVLFFRRGTDLPCPRHAAGSSAEQAPYILASSFNFRWFACIIA